MQFAENLEGYFGHGRRFPIGFFGVFATRRQAIECKMSKNGCFEWFLMYQSGQKAYNRNKTRRRGSLCIDTGALQNFFQVLAIRE